MPSVFPHIWAAKHVLGAPLALEADYPASCGCSLTCVVAPDGVDLVPLVAWHGGGSGVQV